MSVNINITVNGEDVKLTQDEEDLKVKNRKTKGGSETILELPDKVEQPDEKSILDLFMY
jgi:urease accessory protein UreE